MSDHDLITAVVILSELSDKGLRRALSEVPAELVRQGVTASQLRKVAVQANGDRCRYICMELATLIERMN